MKKRIFGIALAIFVLFSTDLWAQSAKMKPHYGKTFIGKTKEGKPVLFSISKDGKSIKTASGGKLDFFKEVKDVSVYKMSHGGHHEHYYGFQIRDEKSLNFASLDNDRNSHEAGQVVNLSPKAVAKKMKDRELIIVVR